MQTPTWTEADSAAAERIWAEYQAEHDLSDRTGQTAGIDPQTGEIWFGQSVVDVVAQRDALGLTSPLRFERVGFKAYLRKGGHRLSTV